MLFTLTLQNFFLTIKIHQSNSTPTMVIGTALVIENKFTNFK